MDTRTDEIHELDRFLSQGYSAETYHCLMLQLHGIILPDAAAGDGAECVYLDIPYQNARRTYVPRKIPVARACDGFRYAYINERIIYLPANESVFGERPVRLRAIIKDADKYAHGYTFPFMGTDNPFYELRINPRNTGHCPGRCAFCHRETSHRSPAAGLNGTIPAKAIIDSIVHEHGSKALAEINHISVITELFGSESLFLNYLHDVKTEISKYTDKKLSFRACAQDVRTPQGLAELHDIVDDDKYSYTLEFFTRRNELMSPYKGIPIDEVITILQNARQAGFSFVKLNYVAGIDPIDDMKRYFESFRKLNLVDMLGLSIFTAFTPEQKKIRQAGAAFAEYYADTIEIINQNDIALYEPNCFDMGFPDEMVNKCRIIHNPTE